MNRETELRLAHAIDLLDAKGAVLFEPDDGPDDRKLLERLRGYALGRGYYELSSDDGHMRCFVSDSIRLTRLKWR